jgi:hypothetical protein
LEGTRIKSNYVAEITLVNVHSSIEHADGLTVIKDQFYCNEYGSKGTRWLKLVLWTFQSTAFRDLGAKSEFASILQRGCILQ